MITFEDTKAAALAMMRLPGNHPDRHTLEEAPLVVREKYCELAHTALNAALPGILAAHERRVTELLEHANELTERARAAERQSEGLKVALKACAVVVSSLAALEDE